MNAAELLLRVAAPNRKNSRAAQTGFILVGRQRIAVRFQHLVEQPPGARARESI
jgi:hypothetical protein